MSNESEAREVPLCLVCMLPATRGLWDGKLFWCGKHGPFYDYVSVRRDLAQRILAALEDHGAEYDGKCRSLGRELREVLKK